jgi:hypothetical protein
VGSFARGSIKQWAYLVEVGGGELGHDVGLLDEDLVELVGVITADRVLQDHDAIPMEGRDGIGEMLVVDGSSITFLVRQRDVGHLLERLLNLGCRHGGQALRMVGYQAKEEIEVKGRSMDAIRESKSSGNGQDPVCICTEKQTVSAGTVTRDPSVPEEGFI